MSEGKRVLSKYVGIGSSVQEAEFDLITSCSTADIFVGKKVLSG